jgi:hypothetical protein
MKKVVLTDSWAPKRRCWRPRQRPSLEEIFKNISRDDELLAGVPTMANSKSVATASSNTLAKPKYDYFLRYERFENSEL